MADLFGGKPKAMKPQAPAPMPDPENPAAREEAQKAVLARRGRRSTILSPSRPGYDSYSGSRTGSAT